jgi:hypothetical protein
MYKSYIGFRHAKSPLDGKDEHTCTFDLCHRKYNPGFWGGGGRGPGAGGHQQQPNESLKIGHYLLLA